MEIRPWLLIVFLGNIYRLPITTLRDAAAFADLLPGLSFSVFLFSDLLFLNRFLIELIYLKGKGIVFSDKDKDFAAESVRRTDRTIIEEKTESQKKRLSRPKISVYISCHFLDRF